jgi:hypothetical protein
LDLNSEHFKKTKILELDKVERNKSEIDSTELNNEIEKLEEKEKNLNIIFLDLELQIKNLDIVR